MSNRTTQYVLLCLLALGLGIAVMWLPKLLTPQSPSHQVLETNPHCRLEQSICYAKNQHTTVSLEITPKQIGSAVPLTFEVSVDDPGVTAVGLHLEGRDMYMGLNQTQLEPVVDKPGHWRGISELAVCTTGEMVWRAKVILQKDQSLTEAQYYFTAQ